MAHKMMSHQKTKLITNEGEKMILEIGDKVTEAHPNSHKTTAIVSEICKLECDRIFYKVKFEDNGQLKESGLLPSFRLKKLEA